MGSRGGEEGRLDRWGGQALIPPPRSTSAVLWVCGLPQYELVRLQQPGWVWVAGLGSETVVHCGPGEGPGTNPPCRQLLSTLLPVAPPYNLKARFTTCNPAACMRAGDWLLPPAHHRRCGLSAAAVGASGQDVQDCRSIGQRGARMAEGYTHEEVGISSSR